MVFSDKMLRGKPPALPPRAPWDETGQKQKRKAQLESRRSGSGSLGRQEKKANLQASREWVNRRSVKKRGNTTVEATVDGINVASVGASRTTFRHALAAQSLELTLGI